MSQRADEPDAADREKAGRLDHSGGEASGDGAVMPPQGDASPQTGGEAGETETVDRDALHQADYGGVREPQGAPDPALPSQEQQGGATDDDAAGGGREPTGTRNRDYDPDGDRAGL